MASKFTIANGVLTGPTDYMQETGHALVDRILDGKDSIFNITSHLSPSVEIAICVRLQTDYAGWLGMKQLQRLSRPVPVQPIKNDDDDDDWADAPESAAWLSNYDSGE